MALFTYSYEWSEEGILAFANTEGIYVGGKLKKIPGVFEIDWIGESIVFSQALEDIYRIAMLEKGIRTIIEYKDWPPRMVTAANSKISYTVAKTDEQVLIGYQIVEYDLESSELSIVWEGKDFPIPFWR